MKTKFIFLLIVVAVMFSSAGHGQISPNTIYPAQGIYVPGVFPFDGVNGYSYNASIYKKSTIGLSGRINALTFYVDSICLDSVTITISFENLTDDAFGGLGTWAFYTFNATQVYSGKVAFNIIGEKTINLQTPFDYDNNKNLGIYISCAWGGVGPTTLPYFRCKEIDSSVEQINLSWRLNHHFPTSDDCALTDFLPAIGLKFVAPNQPVIVASQDACNIISLATTVSVPSQEKILIAANHNGVMTTPACGEIYSMGGTLSDGTEIIYVGPAGNIEHSGLISGANYRYKGWAYTTSHIYSATPGLAASSVNYTIPYSAIFDGGWDLPEGWSGDFENLMNHGVEDGQCIAAQMIPSGVDKRVYSPKFCGLTSQSMLRFDYRIVNVAGYPLNATPVDEIGTILISMINPASGYWTMAYNINSTNHIASTEFKAVEIPIGLYSPGLTQVYIEASSGTGSFFVDIDNFAITDPSGIENNNAEQTLVYPNPAENILNIEISAPVIVNIMDITGRVIMSREHNENDLLSIDISSLNPGLYLIECSTGTTTKFIKL